MKLMSLSLLSFLLVSKMVLAIGIIGSDGPTPFSRVPAPRKISIPLEGMVSTFSILEKTERIAYVDTKRIFRVYDLNKGQETEFGGFSNQLYPVSSPDGRSVLSFDFRNLKKVVGKGSGQDILLPPATHFLGWDSEGLYLLKKLERVNSESWRLSFLIYNQDRNQVHHKTCDFSPENNPKALKIGNGHLFPDLLLYSEKPKEGFTDLSFYVVNLKGRNGLCQVDTFSDKSDSIRGNISSVNWMPDGRNFVVITDHETSNLYFGKPGALLISNLPAGLSYFPNPGSPVIVNINRQKGVGVYSLKSGRYFTLELSVDRGILEGNQIWIDTDVEQLYLSTKEREDKLGGRALHTFSLKGLN